MCPTKLRRRWWMWSWSASKTPLPPRCARRMRRRAIEMSVSATGRPRTRSGRTVAKPADSVAPPFSAKHARMNPTDAAPVSPRKIFAGIGVEGQEPEQGSGEDEYARRRDAFARDEEHGAEAHGRDQREPRGEAVEAVHEVERVRHADDPQDGERPREDADVERSAEEVDLRVQARRPPRRRGARRRDGRAPSTARGLPGRRRAAKSRRPGRGPC